MKTLGTVDDKWVELKGVEVHDLSKFEVPYLGIVWKTDEPTTRMSFMGLN